MDGVRATAKGMPNLNEPPGGEDGPVHDVTLTKDDKPICRTRCFNLRINAPTHWPISKFKSKANQELDLPRCILYPNPENSRQSKEWKTFLHFLRTNEKVAIVSFERCEFYLLAADGLPDSTHAVVLYQMQTSKSECHDKRFKIPDVNHLQSIRAMKDLTGQHCQKVSVEQVDEAPKVPSFPEEGKRNSSHGDRHGNHFAEDSAENASLRAHATTSLLIPKSSFTKGDDRPTSKPHKTTSEHAPNSSHTISEVQRDVLPKNFVRTDPSYLRTLSHTHAGWIFGAIAELVDNSQDANATRLELFVEYLYFRKAGKKVPVLSVVDDGHGMSHTEITRMLSFGHRQSEEDEDKIGRFGMGFKTGAMKLGRDVLVLTQTSSARSVALLSQSYNENKEILEIPIVTYFKQGCYMDIDLSIQSEDCAISNLNAVKEFSPFNEYFIGEKFAKFGEIGIGTQIYIWNLDEWGSNYSLEWDYVNSNGNIRESQGDILIRSRRVRSRPGQLSQKVPLDYSLQSYLEVIFLNPRMQIFVQGSLVECQSLSKCLNKTTHIPGHIMGRDIELTLGMSKLEWERMNCGIFLYWHGRLIEAYKRVGGQVHNADMGRGVIGVIDVTNLMDGGSDGLLVLNNKQGFQDSEGYAELEEWLGAKVDEYWDNNFEILDAKKGDERYKPDHDRVQCNQCHNWRILSTNFDSKSLPSEWFCSMPPFNGKCEHSEQQVEQGVITVGTKRSRYVAGTSTTQHEEYSSEKNMISVNKHSARQYSGCRIPKAKKFSEVQAADVSKDYSSQIEDEKAQINSKRPRKGRTKSSRHYHNLMMLLEFEINGM